MAAFLLIFFMLNLYVKEQVKDELSQLEYPVSYEELGINMLLNNFSLKGVETSQKTFAISTKNVQVSGISYYQFLLKDRLEIDKITLDQPEIRYFPQDSATGDTSQQQQIKVRSFLMKNGNFSRMDSDTSEVDLYVRFPEVEIRGMNSDPNFQIDSYSANLDSVFIKMDAQHFITLGKTNAEDGEVSISDFRITPYDSKAEFVQKIPYEKDRISLQVDQISFENLIIEEDNDTLLFQEPKMVISDAYLELYRNKLVQDDIRRKPLYSEVLREAPIKLQFEQILVENSEIIYEEQVQEERREAVIRFTDVTAEINNLHNIKNEELPQPDISARANFMRGTPVNFTWTFPVFDPGNNFTISGGFGALEGEALDPFLVPAMDVQARGRINSINFDFSGNENILDGNFVLDYDDLEVELLKEEGEEKRSFLSVIANLFVKNEGDAEAQDDHVEVERDKQRSFWNFVWLGLREGFMGTVSRL